MLNVLKRVTSVFTKPKLVDVAAFDTNETDPDKAAHALKRDGLIVLKNAVPKSVVEAFFLHADRMIADMAQYQTQDEVPSDIGYSVTNHSCFLNRVKTEDGQEDRSLIEALRGSPAIDIMHAYFNEDIVYIRAPIMRHQSFDAGRAHVPWHQDGFNLPSDFEALNFWLGLSPNRIGRDSPGLEFLTNRPTSVFSLEQNSSAKNYAFLEPDRQAFDDWINRSPVARPEIGPGDAIVFDKLVFHRTFSTEGMTQRRVSAELRFTKDHELIRAEIANPDRPVETFHATAERPA